MPQPVSPKITSTPNEPGQPYDAASMGSALPKWRKLDANAGKADIHNGRVTQEYQDSGVWRQV